MTPEMKKHLEQVVVAIANEQPADAKSEFSKYLRLKTQSILVGEEDVIEEKKKESKEEKDEEKEEVKEEKDEDDEDKEEKDEVEEAEQVDEKWSKEAEINPKEKGKHSNKSLSQLRSELASAKKAGNTSLERELNFAIRAKTGWGKVKK